MKYHRPFGNGLPSAMVLRRLGATLAMLLASMTMDSRACDGDADCTAASHVEAPVQTVVEAPSKPLSGERRERAKEWFGDPEQMLKENLPGKAVGDICMVTQDCPGGFECVIAGFEGHCMKL